MICDLQSSTLTALTEPVFAGAALKTDSLGSVGTANVHIHYCDRILSSAYDGFFFNLYVKSKAAVYWIMVIQFKNMLFWLLGGHQMFESCLADTCSNPHPKPTAAASSGCPHGPSIEVSSSLLQWTTAASRNEPHSVDVEGDITGYNSPTPTRTVTGRLSVCKVCWLHAWPSKAWTSGQEMTSRDTETRCLLGLQKPLLS